MTRELQKRRVRASEILAKHVVESISATELVFRESGTGCGFMRYNIIGERNLVVTGDLGDAVYEWSSRITFAWLGGLDSDYFIGKCVASEYGRRYEDWSREAAAERFASRVESLDDASVVKVKAIMDECDGNAMMESAGEWNAFAYRDLQDVWADLEGLWNIGMVTSIRALCHAEGLRLAMRMQESKP